MTPGKVWSAEQPFRCKKITMRKTMASLEMTLKVSNENRPAAAGVYKQYKEPLLKQIKGAQSKELLISNEDVQVLHGFASVASVGLGPLCRNTDFMHSPTTSSPNISLHQQRPEASSV
jgi:hypothetical protein